jgi:hypothetical protein
MVKANMRVTKRGRPIATIGPPVKAVWKSPEGAWIGKVILTDDLLETDTSEIWEAVDPDLEPRG